MARKILNKRTPELQKHNNKQNSKTIPVKKNRNKGWRTRQFAWVLGKTIAANEAGNKKWKSQLWKTEISTPQLRYHFNWVMNSKVKENKPLKINRANRMANRAEYYKPKSLKRTTWSKHKRRLEQKAQGAYLMKFPKALLLRKAHKQKSGNHVWSTPYHNKNNRLQLVTEYTNPMKKLEAN